MKKLPPGYRNEWNTWKTLNRLRVGVAQTNKNLRKWGYNAGLVDCDCENEQTEQHILTITLLVCPLNPIPCTPEHLMNATDAATQVANQRTKKRV